MRAILILDLEDYDMPLELNNYQLLISPCQINKALNSLQIYRVVTDGHIKEKLTLEANLHFHE